MSTGPRPINDTCNGLPAGSCNGRRRPGLVVRGWSKRFWPAVHIPNKVFRSCLGIIRLGKGAGQSRLEAACRRALHFKTCSYTSIKSILEKHLEHLPLEQELPLASPAHENLRGGPYYTQSS